MRRLRRSRSELGLHRRIVGKWIRLDALPERNRMTPKDSTPARFHSYLERRWAEGFRNVRGLLRDVQVLGYTGCYSRLPLFCPNGESRPR
jgi:hypothetical protein